MIDSVAITLACGHKHPHDRFCRDSKGGELPPAEFRCPTCGFHIRRVHGLDDMGWPVVRIERVA